MKATVTTLIFLSLFALSVSGAEIDLEQYRALADKARATAQIKETDDLRLNVQNLAQLALLRNADVVLLVIRGPNTDERYAIAPGSSITDALEVLLQRAKLKKLTLSNGYFRLYDYPTARITTFTQGAILRGRPHPLLVTPENIARHEVMLHYGLQAGDVLVLDLFGPDP